MSGYTKLFASIIASTIWREDNNTRVLWVTMLAMANKHGDVEASLPGLAHMANITPAECQASLGKLLAPDEFSRTPDHEGRRVQVIAGGWHILNHGKYRDKMSKDERREYLALKKREQRARDKVNKESTSVQGCQQVSRVVNKTLHIAEADTKAKALSPSEKAPIAPVVEQVLKLEELPPVKKNGWHPAPEQLRVSALFNRRAATAWSKGEVKAWQALWPVVPEELDLIEIYYRAKLPAAERDIRRRDMATLLNNWNGEVDRARRFNQQHTDDESSPF